MTAPGTTWRAAVPDAAVAVRAVHEPATGAPQGVLFVCAHGAGSHMDHPEMLATAAALRAVGIDVVRFNFAYRERGSGRPDPMPRLMRCVQSVATHARDMFRPARLVLGGRSMGGRAASMLVAEQGLACDGLLLLAYPLHPAGRPDALRDAHLPRIAVPVLCVNGTRDALCERTLMERAARGLSRWTLHWLEGADHGFNVQKRTGRSKGEAMQSMAEAARAWAAALP
jgi:predicted alpha/beta-hydrolase family hydrolase